MTALLFGAVLAVAALLYVLFPLFDTVVQIPKPMRARPAETPENAIDALREIEFDKATGKLSDADYAALKAEYTRTALVELRSRPEAAGVVPVPNVDGVEGLDAAEAAVRHYRSTRRECDTCGPRPEPDPAFCSNCGKYLSGQCSHCGATVDAPASRFCANCGNSLAA